MADIKVEITRFVDEHQPGWVACEFVDAFGARQAFVEKVPIVSLDDLWADSVYPQPGVIRCELLGTWQDEEGRKLVRVSTDKPDGVESTDGKTEFTLLLEKVIGSEADLDGVNVSGVAGKVWETVG